MVSQKGIRCACISRHAAPHPGYLLKYFFLFSYNGSLLDTLSLSNVYLRTKELNDLVVGDLCDVFLAVQWSALLRGGRISQQASKTRHNTQRHSVGSSPSACPASLPLSLSLALSSPPALTCFLCIKGLLSLLSMSSESPDKRRKMESALNQLKKHTVVVADTGDFNGKHQGGLALLAPLLSDQEESRV